jgi:DNA-binding response OmpR family regulator
VTAPSTIGFNALTPATTVTALLVSPFESDHTVLNLVFSASNWKLQSVHDSEAARFLMSQETIPVVICNLRNCDWKALLEAGAQLPHPPKLIVSSRLMDEHTWAEVLNLGGHDVLATPFDAREVFRSVSMAWHSWQNEERSATIQRKASQMAVAGDSGIRAHASAQS